jgi:TolA-binding protein
MSKALWWLAGAVGLVWLVSHEGSTPAPAAYSPSPAPNYAPSYTLPPTVGLPGRYGSGGDEDEDEDRAEEVRQAKQNFEDAADELRSAVDDLRYNRWSGQMSTIRDRLEDADDALSQLESLRPGDPAVQNARDEIDSMHSHMSRLHFENWRTVRPDLDSSASAIEDEAGSVSEDED